MYSLIRGNCDERLWRSAYKLRQGAEENGQTLSTRDRLLALQRRTHNERITGLGPSLSEISGCTLRFCAAASKRVQNAAGLEHCLHRRTLPKIQSSYPTPLIPSSTSPSRTGPYIIPILISPHADAKALQTLPAGQTFAAYLPE
jgi:hypothetical protein